MIALGLVIEAASAALVIAGLVAREASAAPILWTAVAVVLVGLAVVSYGVARARPPRRSLSASFAARADIDLSR